MQRLSLILKIQSPSGTGPGFAVIAAVAASIGAALIGRCFGGNGEA